MKFPAWPQDSTTFKVDILALCASARLAYSPQEDTYKIPLQSIKDTGLDNFDTSAMEIAFSVRKAAGEKQADNSFSDVAYKDPTIAAWKQQKAHAAKEYLEKHKVLPFMQFILQSLMKDKPDNPADYLRKHVDMWEEKTGPYQQAESHKSPPEQRKTSIFVEEQAKELKVLMERVVSGTGTVQLEQLAGLEKKAQETAEFLREDNARLRQSTSSLLTQLGQMASQSEMLMQQKQAINSARSREERMRGGTLEAIPMRIFYKNNILRGCGQDYFDGLWQKFPQPEAYKAQPRLPVPKSKALGHLLADTEAANSVSPTSAGAATPGRRRLQMEVFQEIARMQEELSLLAKENEQLIKELNQAKELVDQLAVEIRQMKSEVAQASG